MVQKFKAVLGLLLAAAAFSTHAQAPASQSTAEIVTALRTHQYDRALALLEAAIQNSPQEVRLWDLKGIALSSQRQTDDALKAFRHALSLAPDDRAALEGAAKIEYDERTLDASATLERLVRVDAHNSVAHAMLGEIAFERKECGKAVAEFEEAGAVLDANPEALEHDGMCLLKDGENEKARPVFERLLILKPADAIVRKQLAALQLDSGDTNGALSTLKPTLSDVADSGALSLASAAYEKQGRTPEAVELLRKAIVLDPAKEDLYVQFAELSFKYQSYQVGVDMVNAGLKIRPDSAALLLVRGILLVQLERYAEAEKAFERADQLQPGSSLVGSAQGILAEQTGSVETAIPVIRERLKARPRDPHLLYLLAENLSAKGDNSENQDEAMRAAEAALTMQSDMAEAHDLLAKIYLARGDNVHAEAQSRLALRYDPEDQTAVYHLIRALHKQGREKEISELTRRLLDLREAADQREVEANRYKLVGESADSGTSQPH